MRSTCLCSLSMNVHRLINSCSGILSGINYFPTLIGRECATQQLCSSIWIVKLYRNFASIGYNYCLILSFIAILSVVLPAISLLNFQLFSFLSRDMSFLIVSYHLMTLNQTKRNDGDKRHKNDSCAQDQVWFSCLYM